MNAGTVVGIFVLGAAVGALLESIVRSAMVHRIREHFVEELHKDAQVRKG
jgi:hypothetical protein